MASRRPVRASTALLAGACLLAQATALVHLGLVRHQLCFEHPGELVEVQAGRPAATAPTSTSRALSRGRSLASVFAAHDHCPVLASQRDRTPAGGQAAATANHPSALAPRLSALAPPLTVDRLFVAPKQSPPQGC